MNKNIIFKRILMIALTILMILLECLFGRDIWRMIFFGAKVIAHMEIIIRHMQRV